LPTSVLPSTGVPEIVGGEVFSGRGDARTTGVGSEVALSDPSALIAFTRRSILCPTSFAVSV
jgi:hypothetical protein